MISQYSLSQHPFFLATAFLLEVIALVALAYWGWSTQSGFMRLITAIGLPLLMAIVWAVFRSEYDVKAIIAIPATMRLILEVALLSLPVILLWLAGKTDFAMALLLLIVIQYFFTYDHVYIMTVAAK